MYLRLLSAAGPLTGPLSPRNPTQCEDRWQPSRGARRAAHCESGGHTSAKARTLHCDDSWVQTKKAWNAKPAEERTNKDYFCCALKEWSRAWDPDWDGRHPAFRAGQSEKDWLKKQPSQTVRHIYLIRHGQYELEKKEHGLTELGKVQSQKTGARLRAMADGLKKDHYGEVKIEWKRVVSSGMLRARQTADIIAQELGLPVEEYDPILNEGKPCIPHPGPGPDFESKSLAKLMQDPPRVEAAFKEFIHRKENWKTFKREKVDETYTGTSSAQQDNGQMPTSPSGEGDSEAKAKGKKQEQVIHHEYEIVVCHQNVIRYFVCRALQLPPEAWLRFRGENCALTELIVYDDGRLSLGRFGDQGHLTIEETTFH